MNSKIVLLGVGWLATAGGALAAGPVPPANLYAPYPQVSNITEGIAWPKGQALPTFATPAAKMDTLVVQDLSKDEQITFSSLQGQVNRNQPGIYLLENRADEGRDTWANTPTVNFAPGNPYDRATKYDLVAKYAKEVTGVVLYDPAVSPHYRNLAGTVAAQRNALPVTAGVLAQMKEHGIALEVIEDLTSLKFTTPVEIYQYLYDHYWPTCGKRVLVSAKPHDERGGGDYHHTRDIAAATGSAVVWLNTLVPAEREILRKFFGDMKAGEAIALGWYTTERTGIPTATEFGIGTMPADFFVSASVYAGTDHHIRIPAVPKMPALQNKVHVAIIISDGDNIQYTQHAMRKNWERTAPSRGKVPLNWTIAPGLVDIAPGIMNYYYTTATPNDCFVTGPSGMGYLMPFNTLTEPGAPVGDKLTDPARMDGYARLTETYLQRSGLRVMTIWDDATPMQRRSYEKNCRHLYGATVQNFKDVPTVAGGVENNRLRFDKLVVPYAGSFDHIHGSLVKEIQRWDGKSPLFLSYQVDVWGEMRANRIVELHEQLQREFPDKVEFVRADHYFNLSNEANGLPFNLCLASTTTVKSGDPAASADAATDGTPETMWTSSEKSKRWLGFEFDGVYQLNRCVIRHAGDNGMSRDTNIRDFIVQGSVDGKSWKTLAVIKGNTENVTDVEFPAAGAKFVKITVLNAGEDSTARIADVEIYGRK
ncbi:MAG: discoidin domain-containing protein [Luteolibacter sp.]|uniref:discoidin domain-containing protein n=1 Tax=Luteolibacter sp. TaxID=1962973 RepID=UPI003266A214